MYINRIKTINLKTEIRTRVMPYIQRLSKQEYVEGMVLLGGLSNTSNRDFMDKFSDVDMSIFIDGSRTKFTSFNQLPDFEFHIPYQGEMLEINVHQQFIEDEINKEWDESKKEAYSYTSEIVIDRHGKIADLIASKTAFNDEYRRRRLSIILSQYYWLVNINPLRQVERGYCLNGMDLLNTGIDLLLEGIYLYNRRYRPHPKWRVEIAFDLEWTPDNMKELLTESFQTEAFNKETILRRKNSLGKMFVQLEKKVTSEGLFGALSPYKFACLYAYPDRQMSERSHADILLEQLPEGTFNGTEVVLFRGLVNEYFINNLQELEIQQEMPEVYAKLIEKLRRKI